MKALAQKLGVADYVTFTGRVPDAELLAMLNTADVCVNPDVANDMNDKSTMNKIMEYMALGKPIVQFDLTEGRFSAQEASLYAKKNDPRDMAREDPRAGGRSRAPRAHGRVRPAPRRERARVALRGAEAPGRVRLALEPLVGRDRAWTRCGRLSRGWAACVSGWRRTWPPQLRPRSVALTKRVTSHRQAVAQSLQTPGFSASLTRLPGAFATAVPRRGSFEGAMQCA